MQKYEGKLTLKSSLNEQKRVLITQILCELNIQQK